MNLPKGWIIDQVEAMGEVVGGRQLSPDKLNTPGQKQYPYLRVANVFDGCLELSDVKRMCFSDKELNTFSLQKDDILLNEGQSFELVGRCAIYNGEIKNCCFQNTLVRFRPKDNVLPNFAFYQFQNCLYNGKFRSIAKRTTSIAHLGMQRFANLELMWPPLPEQKAIAGLLSTWDAAIEKTEQLIAAKEKQFQWLLDELITKPSKIGKWKEIEIGNLLHESRIPDTVNFVEKRLSVRLHLKGVEVRDVRGSEAEGATNYFIRRKGQFIYGKQNVFRGAIGIVPKELDGYSTTQDLPAFDFVGKVDPIWFLWFFSRPNFYEGLEKFATGSGSKRLHSEELFSIKINLPPLKEQVNVAQYLDFANRELNRLKQLAEQYKLQKRGLMQRLLTGQWRLKEFT